VGIDLKDHSSTQASEPLLESADFIFGMTNSHLDSANYYLGEDSEDKLFLMREFIEGDQDKEIPDPFGGNFTEYENVRDLMVEAIPSLIKFLKTQFPAST
jgi:protein-tyrosine-phosphatase